MVFVPQTLFLKRHLFIFYSFFLYSFKLFIALIDWHLVFWCSPSKYPRIYYLDMVKNLRRSTFCLKYH